MAGKNPRSGGRRGHRPAGFLPAGLWPRPDLADPGLGTAGNPRRRGFAVCSFRAVLAAPLGLAAAARNPARPVDRKALSGTRGSVARCDRAAGSGRECGHPLAAAARGGDGGGGRRGGTAPARRRAATAASPALGARRIGAGGGLRRRTNTHPAGRLECPRTLAAALVRYPALHLHPFGKPTGLSGGRFWRGVRDRPPAVKRFRATTVARQRPLRPAVAGGSPAGEGCLPLHISRPAGSRHDRIPRRRSAARAAGRAGAAAGHGKRDRARPSARLSGHPGENRGPEQRRGQRGRGQHAAHRSHDEPPARHRQLRAVPCADLGRSQADGLRADQGEIADQRPRRPHSGVRRQRGSF